MDGIETVISTEQLSNLPHMWDYAAHHLQHLPQTAAAAGAALGIPYLVNKLKGGKAGDPGPEPLNISEVASQVGEYMEAAGIGKVNNVAVTCVDPAYPASSLGDRLVEEGFTELGETLQKVDVRYTHGDHPLKGHVKDVPDHYKEVSLKIENVGGKVRLTQISEEEVHESLDDGVVQIAYDPETGTVVLGIPGDSYAFKKDGPGFGFGKPGQAHTSPEVAEQVLDGIMKYARDTNPEGDLALIGSRHPDCGLYRENMGRGSGPDKHVPHHPEDWNSGYGIMETLRKLGSTGVIRALARKYGAEHHTVKQKYVPRETQFHAGH